MIIQRIALSTFLVAILCNNACSEEAISYVDPYIGSGGHGHVFVGASVPFGAVQVGPNNFHQGWDWCSGYHHSDNVLVGFSHLHLSGTGIPDLGDILLMPHTKKQRLWPGTRDNPTAGYASTYSHNNEVVEPSYYSVKLDENDIKVELTATERVGLHRYTFPDGAEKLVAIDLTYENGGGRVTESSLEMLNDNTIVGSRFSRGWAKNQRVFFALKTEAAINDFEIFEKENPIGGTKATGKELRGRITFNSSSSEVMLKVGISPVSIENAIKNIEQELPNFDFNQVKSTAKQKWNDQLRVIQVETDDAKAKRIFTTALYHTMIAPVLFDDVNGEYRGSDAKTYSGSANTNYSIFSLWDTYRAAHPLFTLTQPKRVDAFVKSMLRIYEQQGKLPVWHLLGNETNTMVGYHSVPVIVDAFLKGLTTSDAEELYQAIRASAMRDERGLSFIKERGYIPADEMTESVALAMEYAIDDWCIARMAKELGKIDDYELFTKRSKFYQNYFDPQTKFMRGKLTDGTWRTPFDPIASSHRKDDYCEGNGWQYLWLVPQDPYGLIKLLGGDKAFCDKLDQLFAAESITTEHASSDITGLIGQYAHGNEPGHHTTYLYAYAGEQWKTAKLVREILTTLYSDQPDGLSGNEDCGQMSAWYILSSMGIYPMNPSAGIYVMGSPLFDRSVINLPEGKTFSIVAENNSAENIYIQSAKLNGQAYTKTYLHHSDIAKGGELVLTMGSKPNLEFGKLRSDRPIH